MSILTANLKHLYQRRGYWLVHLILGLFAYLCIMTALKYSGMKPIDRIMSGLTGIITFLFLGEVHFMGLVLLAFPIGLFAASMPIEVLSKPFTYCLPGHRKVPGQFVLLIGIVTNALGSLIFLAYPDLTGWQKVSSVCSAFGTGSMMYSLGVWLAWRTPFAVLLLILLPWMWMPTSSLKLTVIAQQVIVEAPFEITILGVLSSLAGWWWLTNKTHVRRFCTIPRLGLFDVWNKEKVERYKQSRASGKKKKPKGYPHPWVEEFFLNRMNQFGYLRAGRHIWGGLYTTFAMPLSTWKAQIAWLPVVFMVYYTSPIGENLLGLLAGTIVANIRAPIRTSVFTPQGRKERLITSAVVLGAIVVLTTGIITAIIALSVILAPIMPKITLQSGLSFTFHALDSRPLCLLVLVMPVALMFKVILHKRPALMRLSVFMLLIFSVSVPDIWFNPNVPTLLSMLLEPIIKPIPIATFVVSSWLVFAAVLWYFCMKRPLVGQSKTY